MAKEKHSIIKNKRRNQTKNLPGVNFWLTTAGNTDLGLSDEEVEAEGDAGGEALSLLVGLSQKGINRLRLGGRPPKTGSQSNERFRVAHAIFYLTVCRC